MSWQSKKLGEVAEYSKTRINASELDDGHFIGVDCLISDLGGKLPSEHTPTTGKLSEYRAGDVLQSNIRPYLRKAYLATDTGGASADVLIIRPKQEMILPEFLFFNTTSNNYFDYVMSAAKGVKMPRGDKAHIMNYEISLPPLAEQEAIVERVRDFDEYLGLVRAKVRSCEELKKGLSQRIFSGEIRFRGDDGRDFPAWERKKLGEVGKVRMCKRIMKNQTAETGDIPFYKIGTFGGKADAFISQELYDEYKAKYSYPKIGDILLSASGTIGRKVVYSGEPEYFQDSNIIWFENDETKITNEFLYYLYDTITWTTEGATIKRLYNDNLEKTEAPLPSLPEQQKIAIFLSGLDAEITSLKELLRAAEAQKKWLLNNLVTGKIRLPEFSDNKKGVKK